MSAALETLLLAFAAGHGLAVPARALFLGAVPHPDLKAWPEVTGWQPWKPAADRWERAGFERVDAPEGKWPLVLVLPGKSRDETLAWFTMARDHLHPGGTIVVAMPNEAGAGRFEKEFKRAVGEVTSVQKHKCRAFHATEDGSWNEALFNEWRDLGKARTVDGTDFIVQAGIFSVNHIDPGSQLLLDHLPKTLRGHVADFGAGWGSLSDGVLRGCPEVKRIDLFEADARALDCARGNLAHWKSSRLESPPCEMSDVPELGFHWHNVAAGVPGCFDAIVMNPPFHTGQATDIELGRSFLTAAKESLNPGGQLWVVANRQLPYEQTLNALGFTWRKVVEDAVYKVIEARKK